MQDIRRTCIELVESIDQVVRRERKPEKPTAFDDAVLGAMDKLAAVPAIHRLRGRVREASDAEVLMAMTAMAQMADAADGVQLLNGLIASAIEGGRPEVAARLREIQGNMAKQRREVRSN